MDDYFTKLSFIDLGEAQAKLDMICKLRKDDNLKYLHKESKRKEPGRPKKHDDKINVNKIDKH